MPSFASTWSNLQPFLLPWHFHYYHCRVTELDPSPSDCRWKSLLHIFSHLYMKNLRLRDSRQFPPHTQPSSPPPPDLLGSTFQLLQGSPFSLTMRLSTWHRTHPSVFRRGSCPPLRAQHVAQFPTHCGLSARAALSKSVVEPRLVASFHHCQDDSFC